MERRYNSANASHMSPMKPAKLAAPTPLNDGAASPANSGEVGLLLLSGAAGLPVSAGGAGCAGTPGATGREPFAGAEGRTMTAVFVSVGWIVKVAFVKGPVGEAVRLAGAPVVRTTGAPVVEGGMLLLEDAPQVALTKAA